MNTSQPDHPVRRVAVLVGYGPDTDTAWTSPIRRPARERREVQNAVIQLRALRRSTDLQQAA